ncbi:uncharacterized protein LOC121411367 [Lytechinus variegatus]|uniref:uncharacterized protein LOC121411367 n=1 Tax=Lytechinus variegatus TaxID=7654 RepID=UPI001BB22ED9|nr:uncharacterized protein LOC121411367 [Lytechinus variegatus]
MEAEALGSNFSKKDGIYYSSLSGISMRNFIDTKNIICNRTHIQPCERCSAIVKMATAVDERGIVALKELYHMTTDAGYKSDKAVRKIMQLPAVVFAAGAGKKRLFVAEYVTNFDYNNMIHHLNLVPPKIQLHFSKDEMKEICSLASSEKDRSLIKYVAIKSHNLSAKQSKKRLGVHNPKMLLQNVADAIVQQKQIHDSMWDLALAQATAELKAASGQDTDSDKDEVDSSTFSSDSDLDMTLTQSSEQPMIETESESDNPEEYLTIKDTSSKKAKEMVKKISKTILRRTERIAAKKLSKECLLKRKLPKRVSRIVAKYPDIGKVMENYVHDNMVGADAWRRTGVLTFDGNLKRGKRVTYQRILEHLQDHYQDKFSYGTIVQLCACHNRKRISAKRYKGVAQITSRRARKGWNIRLNPDSHWSNTLYRDLDTLQLQDGRNKLVLNRDDAAGFRLDTTYTHKQYKSVSLKEQPELTTHTDYVNKYKSVLQTSMHLIVETENTAQKVLGVVKAHQLYPKDPSQHMADLYMMAKMDEFATDMHKPIDCIRVDGASDEGPTHLEVQFLWTEWHLNMAKYCTLLTARYAGGSYLNPVELMNGCLTRAHANMFIPSTIHGSNFNEQGIDEAALEKNLRTATQVYINRCNDAPAGRSNIKLVEGCRDEHAAEIHARKPHLLTFLKGSKKSKQELKQKQPDLYAHFQMVWDLRERHMQKGLPHYVFQLLPCYDDACPHPVCRREREDICWFNGGPPLSFVPVPVADPSQPWGGPCSKCSGHCNGHYKQFPDNLTGSKCQPPRDVIGDAFKTLERPNGEFKEESITKLARENLLSVEDVKMWTEHLESVKQRRLYGALKAQRTRREKKMAAAQGPRTENLHVDAELGAHQTQGLQDEGSSSGNEEDDQEIEGSDDNGSEGDDEAEEDDYCICHRGEYGRMIGCDNVACIQQWFHYECVGIRRKPRGSWYCPNCR